MPTSERKYMVDYYAVLSVNNDAAQEDIRKAYLNLQKLYHPDKYEHLAEEFKNQAARRSAMLAEAYAVLSNPDKKAVYDSELAAWQGPISLDGTPIDVIGGAGFSPNHLLDSDAHDTQKLKDMFTSMSGYNEAVFEAVETAYHNSPNDENLRQAYKAALGQKVTYLALMEDLVWQKAGFEGHKLTSLPSQNEMTRLEEKIDQARRTAEESVTGALLMLASGERKLIGPGSQELIREFKAQPGVALEKYKQKAMASFDTAAEELKNVALAQSQTAGAILRMLRLEYRPNQPEIFSQLILVIESGADTQWLIFCLHEDIITGGVAELNGPISDESALKYISEGYNIAYFIPSDSVDIKDQIEAVVIKHFEKYNN
jgi:curved DNA-binding protein CbpA